jgi:hypothetical protein
VQQARTTSAKSATILRPLIRTSFDREGLDPSDIAALDRVHDFLELLVRQRVSVRRGWGSCRVDPETDPQPRIGRDCILSFHGVADLSSHDVYVGASRGDFSVALFGPRIVSGRADIRHRHWLGTTHRIGLEAASTSGGRRALAVARLVLREIHTSDRKRKASGKAEEP